MEKQPKQQALIDLERYVTTSEGKRIGETEFLVLGLILYLFHNVLDC